MDSRSNPSSHSRFLPLSYVAHIRTGASAHESELRISSTLRFYSGFGIPGFQTRHRGSHEAEGQALIL
ncbi:hypothetical protein C8R41DRAFT_831632 [Lentinula lateritia]|uniref:Uncharacterized protein n=1 Tax=Lentinula lateritia TaxID=40482 RepID=A0ABQ8VFQ5_9AGAR|nr:hypothetical protein C8R41DRAFT_831632 [Lentinula lateritia]